MLIFVVEDIPPVSSHINLRHFLWNIFLLARKHQRKSELRPKANARVFAIIMHISSSLPLRCISAVKTTNDTHDDNQFPGYVPLPVGRAAEQSQSAFTGVPSAVSHDTMRRNVGAASAVTNQSQPPCTNRK